MEIIIGKNAGFCNGVDFTIKKANELLKEGPIYCLGEIVHNKQVVQDLINRGMKTVKSIEEIPNHERVIFRAHGEPISTYKKAEEKGLKIEDLTCANVKVIHSKVQKAKKDAFIIVIGVKNHPETIGTIGFAGENSYIIENESDILDAYIKYEQTMLGRVFVISQTTFSSNKFNQLAKEIEINFYETDVIIDKTICNSTENRQLEVAKMSENCDVMLIIGDENSSNTRKLFEISQENCQKVYYIQTVEDMRNIQFNKNNKVGIMAGASTPRYIIEDVKKYLEGNFK